MNHCMSQGCTKDSEFPADNYAWDPDYMGSSMMVPVLYVTWLMVVVFVSLMGESQLARAHMHACKYMLACALQLISPCCASYGVSECCSLLFPLR